MQPFHVIMTKLLGAACETRHTNQAIIALTVKTNRVKVAFYLCVNVAVVKILSSELSLYCYGYQGHNGVYEKLALIVKFCQAILVFKIIIIKVIMAFMM